MHILPTAIAWCSVQTLEYRNRCCYLVLCVYSPIIVFFLSKCSSFLWFIFVCDVVAISGIGTIRYQN